MSAYEIYEKQNVKNIKKYRLFKISFIAFWLIFVIFLFSGAGIDDTYSGVTLLLLCLMMINTFFYIYLTVCLVSAAGKNALWWGIGVFMFNAIGVIVSYLRMKPIAIENGWIQNKKSIENKQNEQQSEPKKVNIRIGLERISMVIFFGIAAIFIVFGIGSIIGGGSQSTEWGTLLICIGLAIGLIHYVVRWIIRGFLPKE